MTRLMYPRRENLQADIDVQLARTEQIISIGRRIGEEAIADIPVDDLLSLTGELISIYEDPCLTGDLRKKAADVVAKLAAHDYGVLKLVISNAEEYAESQHIDDAFPYSPNGFEVLARVGRRYEEVVRFLRRVAQHDFGVAGWSANQALSEIDDFQNEHIVLSSAAYDRPPENQSVR